MLVLKSLLITIGVGVANLALTSAFGALGYINTSSVMMIIVEAILVISFLQYKFVLKPLNDLYDALNVISFDKEVIDFSKLDCLELIGFKELKEITEKFKYLLDVISERINRINSESYKAEHDPLTDCYNKGRLENVQSMYENARSFAVIFVDVNNLKKMNDVFGHEAGDVLIKAAADKMKFWNTYGDVYRIGGDEFMVVVTNRTPDYVQKLYDKWYPTVGQLNRDTDGFHCVLSCGVAFGERGSDFEAVRVVADERMYEHKRKIKEFYGEPMR